MLNPFICMYINNIICVSEEVLYFFPLFIYFVKNLFGGNKKKRKVEERGQATFATEKHRLGKYYFQSVHCLMAFNTF